jgi:hypothetical protein
VKANCNDVDLLPDFTGSPRAKSRDVVVKSKRVLGVESDAKNAIDVTVVRNDTNKSGGFYRSFDNTACLTPSSNVRPEEVNLSKTFYSQTRQCHIREDSDL